MFRTININTIETVEVTKVVFQISEQSIGASAQAQYLMQNHHFFIATMQRSELKDT